PAVGVAAAGTVPHAGRPVHTGFQRLPRVRVAGRFEHLGRRRRRAPGPTWNEGVVCHVVVQVADDDVAVGGGVRPDVGDGVFRLRAEADVIGRGEVGGVDANRRSAGRVDADVAAEDPLIFAGAVDLAEGDLLDQMFALQAITGDERRAVSFGRCLLPAQ